MDNKTPSNREKRIRVQQKQNLAERCYCLQLNEQIYHS